MLKIGDTVKVIDKFHYEDGTTSELIKIGTICTVKDVFRENDGSCSVEIEPQNEIYPYPFWYEENELEKGHLEWIKDE